MNLPTIAGIDSEADAYLFLERLRWKDGVVCPHCSARKVYFIEPSNGVSRKTRTGSLSERRVWKCAACRKQFSVLTGTPLQGTRQSLRKWLLVLTEECRSNNSASVRRMARQFGMNPGTTWMMQIRARLTIAEGLL